MITSKKLAFNKETVSTLDSKEMNIAQGGANPPSVLVICQTFPITACITVPTTNTATL